MTDYPKEHWVDVLEILTEAVESVGFEPSLVSYADESGIIQKRIVQNLYENPIVVCDVSGKNPNVMFELGLRLAFDKPTIIVKDDETAYSFDTSPIEHLPYPRDLRFGKVNQFKAALAKKIEATHKMAESDPDYTAFLKHFGTFTVAKLDSKEVSEQAFVLQELQEMRSAISSLARHQRRLPRAHIVGGARPNLFESDAGVRGATIREHIELAARLFHDQDGGALLHMTEIMHIVRDSLPSERFFGTGAAYEIEFQVAFQSLYGNVVSEADMRRYERTLNEGGVDDA